MCGFLVTSVPISDLAFATEYLARRGPDDCSIVERDGITFVHFLLSITGPFARQPFCDEEIMCVYNGEIYNSNYRSDGECLIPAYRKYGAGFTHSLDGEFAIV